MNFRKRFMIHFRNKGMFKACLIIGMVIGVINALMGSLPIGIGLIGVLVVSLIELFSRAILTQTLLSVIYSLLKEDEPIQYFVGDDKHE